MKTLTPTLAWLAAAAVAVLLALAGPDGWGPTDLVVPHGATAPR
jgi:hypothetical protein